MDDGANHLKTIPILVRLQLLRQPLTNLIEDNGFCATVLIIANMTSWRGPCLVGVVVKCVIVPLKG